jgi:hypothetical protein
MSAGPKHQRAREIPCVVRPLTPGEVSEADYFELNPDVRKSGMTAIAHFDLAGNREGRFQSANQSEIAALREEKLKRVRFRYRSEKPRRFGAPLDFLTAQHIAEFEIPDAPPVSASQYGGPFIDEIVGNPDRMCLDVGAGLRSIYTENIINTEIYQNISTDVLCVGEDLPFEDDQFDYVLCMAVLEHTRRPWEVAREICRVLKPGGKVLVDYPFLQGVHGYPHHYFNATPKGSISLFEDQCQIISSDIELNNHPMQSLWWTLLTWRNGLTADEAAAFDALSIAKILATPPDRHLEEAYCRNLNQQAMRTIPAGSTLVAQKKSSYNNGYATNGFAARPPVHANNFGDSARQDRIAALEQEVAILRASTSWRLTAPLRAIFRLVK